MVLFKGTGQCPKGKRNSYYQNLQQSKDSNQLLYYEELEEKVVH